MNLKLPACVYVPFVKDSDEYCNILNLVVEETKVFSTKQRSPFYICLEVYDPIEAFSEATRERFFAKISEPITLKVILLLYSLIYIQKESCPENIQIKCRKGESQAISRGTDKIHGTVPTFRPKYLMKRIIITLLQN